MKRREFIALSAFVFEAAFLGWPDIASARPKPRRSPLDLKILSDRLGEHYFNLFPLERDLPRLEHTLHFRTGGDQQSVLALLKGDIHNDFGGGNTFRFEGWIFSRTEGRLCAYKTMAD